MSVGSDELDAREREKVPERALEMENGKRKMENGEWRMENGKWRMAVQILRICLTGHYKRRCKSCLQSFCNCSVTDSFRPASRATSLREGGFWTPVQAPSQRELAAKG